MALKMCNECGNDMSTKAASCPKCGAVVKKKTGYLGYMGPAFLIFIALGVIGSLMNDGTSADQRTSSPADGGDSAKTESFRTAPAWEDGLTKPQKNAVRSAKQHLGIRGFSRSGLIQQLSSNAGDGYSVADATAAVDSLNVDWNEQALRSAKQYLSIQGFSCKGLIEQLSSNAGDRYTVSQATYGARQAGACEQPNVPGPQKELYMHGMNVRVQIQPGKVEEAAKLLREEVMPTAANYKGFIQNFLIVDAPNDRLATLSVWESESDAKAIYEDEGGLYQTAIAKLKPMLAGPPDAWMGPLTRVDK